ncbi:MAG: hypothetical protein GY809_32100, partial [Planctomycetes bacterium]|nr:hypothetical protein [Planctomycetota bacterium]
TKSETDGLVNGKADETIPATAGNIAALDANGNLQDTGIHKDSLASGTPDWGNIQDKPDVFPPDAHNHAIGDVTDLQGALDDKADVSALDGKLDTDFDGLDLSTAELGGSEELLAKINGTLSRIRTNLFALAGHEHDLSLDWVTFPIDNLDYTHKGMHVERIYDEDDQVKPDNIKLLMH